MKVIIDTIECTDSTTGYTYYVENNICKYCKKDCKCIAVSCPVFEPKE